MCRWSGVAARRIVALVALSGCTEPEPRHRPDVDTEAPPTSPPTPTVDSDAEPTDTDTDTGTTDTGPTDTGTGPTAAVFDCSTISMTPLSIAPVQNAIAYHDVAFTADDKLLGNDLSALVKVDDLGVLELVLPEIGVVQQFDWLEDGSGDLVVAVDDNDSIARITPAGGTSILATDIGAYGVTVGPDGFVYTANTQVIHKIDPATGQKTVILDNGYSPKVIDFSVDGTKLIFGTLGGGRVYSMELDASYNPVAPPALVAEGLGGWHDGLGVDICDNIYVADYNTRALYRVTPNGTVQTYLDPADADFYGHGLEWGSGSTAWKDTALYLPQPYNGNTVVEVDLGIPSRTWQGTVIGTVPF